MHFEQYYDKLENVLKNNYFLLPSQKYADAIKFLLAARLQKVCDWIHDRLSYMHTTFHGPSSSESNFRQSGTNYSLLTSRGVVDQKSPGQIGLMFDSTWCLIMVQILFSLIRNKDLTSRTLVNPQPPTSDSISFLRTLMFSEGIKKQHRSLMGYIMFY